MRSGTRGRHEGGRHTARSRTGRHIEAGEILDLILGARAPGVDLMTTGDLEAAIAAGGLGGDFSGDPDDATSREEANRLRMLIRYRNDPETLHRPYLVADGSMLQRIAGLIRAAPNMVRPLEVVRRAAILSKHGRQPMVVPPLVLVGPPGTGKTRVATALARALGTSSLTLHGTAIADPHPFLGSAVNWRGSGLGGIAKALMAATTASPVIIIDEAEKVGAYDRRENPLDALLPVLEPTTASSFRDNFLDVPMRAEHVVWVFCANSLDGLSRPLLDRCAIFGVDELSGREQRHALEDIVDDVLVAQGLPLADLGPEALAALAEFGLRRARTLVTSALAEAIEAGRDWPTVDDIRRAAALLGAEGPHPAKRQAGFIHHD